MAEKIFANGLIIKRNEKAPDFVICNLSFKVGDFVKFLDDNSKNGWVNIQIKRAKDGVKLYGELDLWEKAQGEVKKEQDDNLSVIDTQDPLNGQITPNSPISEVDSQVDSIPF